jgi:nucleoside-diphosphate-sugar epimerase
MLRNMKHTILGAGGSVGNALTYQLLKTNEEVRLVSRRGFFVPGAESFKADLLSPKQTFQSVKDSDIVYLCAGLPYDSKIWNEQWPKIMQNTIDACISTNAKLIFFDNVYMYGRVKGKMTEITAYNPCSKKGEIRAKTAMILENEISKKNINAIIARSADLYGPYATKTSILYILAIDRLMKGRGARWLIDVETLHSFTYTNDCANGMILLSKSDRSYNQTWHLPTYNPLDGETLIHMIAKELGTDPDYTVLNRWMLGLLSIFYKTVSESYEMLYQSEYNYYFDSTKFNQFFDYKPKSYYEGIRNTIEFLKQANMKNYSSDRLPIYPEKVFIKSLSV